MKTTLDLPRPLLLRLASHAARKRVPISHYVTESLEKAIPSSHPAPKPPSNGRSVPDPLFQSLREELGL